MNRRELILAGMAIGIAPAITPGQTKSSPGSAEPALQFPPGTPPNILLNDYVPQSIYKIPITTIDKAKFPIYDAHCHGRGEISVREMVKIMDDVGMEQTVVFTGATTVDRFKEISRQYAAY